MNNKLLTMVAMMPSALIGVLMMGGNKADGQSEVAVTPLSVIQGPVEAEVLKVTDADTLKVAAYVWPDAVTVKDIRIRGIDAPELRGRCKYEKDLANAAKTFVTDLINKNKKRVKLSVVGCNQAEGGGFGRCLSDVHVGSVPIAGTLIEKGLARTNNGEPRKTWCDGKE
jgi:micrococcal nuclease